jgi:3-hydroxyisobutyrate dehydrogenase
MTQYLEKVINMLGICEAISYAERSGLDPIKVLKSIESGAAGSWSLSNLGPRMIDGNFEHMGIAEDAAKEMGLPAPGLSLAKSLYKKLADQGEENSGTHALFKLYVQSGG